ncbi:CPBP family intramembrane glutamic endopeptidase [Haloarcula regularis]|uniref:CPBP family intramembrane glutamic endopeptidase n=1 Tax=Haloarcula regularis TaxID=3033392 RepID=UPI00387E61CA
MQLVIVVTAVVTEEILWRGYPIERLTEVTGNVWIGAVVSGTVFLAVHFPAWDRRGNPASSLHARHRGCLRLVTQRGGLYAHPRRHQRRHDSCFASAPLTSRGLLKRATGPRHVIFRDPVF